MNMRKNNEKRDRSRIELERRLLPLGIALALFIGVSAAIANFSMKPWLETLLSLLPPIAAAIPTAKAAIGKFSRSRVLSAELMVLLACVGISCMGDFSEAFFILLIFGAEGIFEHIVIGKGRRETPYLAHLRPEYARVELDGKMNMVDPARIRPGTVITVEKNELIPLDGVVVDGSTTVDTSAYSASGAPLDVGVGTSVVSGCINLGDTVRIRVTQLYGNSTLVRTAEAIERAVRHPGAREKRLSRISSLFTPAVIVVALVMVIAGGIITDEWLDWSRRGLALIALSSISNTAFCVSSCYLAGLHRAAGRGIILRGKRELETLASVSTVVMDKTGTVTEGSFSVTGAEPVGISSADLIMLAAAAEYGSTHPIAVSLRRACPTLPDEKHISDMREIPGRGVEAKVYGRQVLVGNEALMRANGISCRYADRHLSVVHVAAGGIYYGYIIIDDRVKDGAKDAVRDLYSLGIEKAVLLTGDTERTGRAVGRALGVSDVMTQLLPEDKVVAIDELQREKHAGRLAFVGDAVSDAKVLAKADVGVAMGAMNAQSAASKAGVLIMSEDILELPQAIGICKSAFSKARLSSVAGIGVKLAALVLLSCGSIGIVAAVAADAAVFVLTGINSFRIYKD